MRGILASLLLLTILAAPAVKAQESNPGQSRIDQLFVELKRERNEVAARRIAGRIAEEWKRDGGATADLLIEWARNAAAQEKFHVALDLLDQAVTLYPEYVEAWSSRALVYLMMEDFSRAMSDLARTLAIEPRHFGAMDGMAGILRATGREESALAIYRRVLEIYPLQRSAQRALLGLTDEHTDNGL